MRSVALKPLSLVDVVSRRILRPNVCMNLIVLLNESWEETQTHGSFSLESDRARQSRSNGRF